MRHPYEHQKRSLGPLFEDRPTELAIRRVEEANTPHPLDLAEADAIQTLAGLPEFVTSEAILPDLSIYAASGPAVSGTQSAPTRPPLTPGHAT